MTYTELQNALTGLTPYQIEQVSVQVIRYLNLNKELENTRPAYCPCCGSVDARFIKKGLQNGKQRYQCKECSSKFTFDTRQITSNSQQPVSSWIAVVEDTLSMKSLDNTARRIGVCHETAFNMRHKLLTYLEAESTTTLDALIEADETYVIESQKGVPVTHRKARKHGEGASKRGLSDEQLCVCVATDRNNHVVAKCVNRAKASGNDLIAALGDHIASDSIILCDGATSYNSLADHTQSVKIELIGHENYGRLYHLNTVNSLHNRIKEMVRRFRGVSTKYLNRYLALFAIVVTCIKGSIEEAADEIRRSLASVRERVTYASSQSDGLLMI